MLKKLFKHYDYSIIVAMALLIAFGLVMIYSSSMAVTIMKFDPPRPSHYFFMKQLQWLAVGAIAFFIAMMLPYKIYERFMKVILLVSLLLLVLVLMTGSVYNYSQRWISIGGFTLQPSELAKLGLIIYLAAIFSRKQRYIEDFRRAVLPPLIIIVVVFFFSCETAGSWNSSNHFRCFRCHDRLFWNESETFVFANRFVHRFRFDNCSGAALHTLRRTVFANNRRLRSVFRSERFGTSVDSIICGDCIRRYIRQRSRK